MSSEGEELSDVSIQFSQVAFSQEPILQVPKFFTLPVILLAKVGILIQSTKFFQVFLLHQTSKAQHAAQ